MFEDPSEELKIFVGNLPFDVDSEKLAVLFEKTPGIIEVAEVIYNKDTDRSRGFGFVTMSTADEVERAVSKFSGYELDGKLLIVNKLLLGHSGNNNSNNDETMMKRCSFIDAP